MPQPHQEEIARLDDIEALLATARDLARRFTDRKLAETVSQIGGALVSLALSRDRMIADWRVRDL